MNLVRIGLMLSLLFILAVPASADIVVDPASIEEVIATDTTKSITIKNTFSQQVDLTISSSSNIADYITISPSTLTIPASSEKTISLTLKPGSYSGKVYYSWKYTLDNVTHSGVAEQSISISPSSIIVYPKEVKASVFKGEYDTYPVTLINPSSISVDVEIDYSGVVDDISDDDFTLKPYSAKIVEIEFKEAGEGKLTYKFYFPGETKTLEQKVTVKVKTIKEFEELKGRVKELETQLYIPEVKVSVENVKVGSPMKVTVQGKVNNKWVPVEKVPVGFNGLIKFTDSSGIVYFTPDKAGFFTLTVYDRLGNVKVERTVEVSKSEIKLKLRDATVGETVTIELPEEGEVTVYRDGVKVGEYTGEKIALPVELPGEYRVVFTSPSYDGEGEFWATSKITIAASVNGKTIGIGEKIKPGSTLELSVTYENGAAADDVPVYISNLPIYGMDDERSMFGFMLTMMTMRDGGFTPFYLETKAINGKVMVRIPDDLQGMLMINAEGDDVFTESASYMLRVEPEPLSSIVIAAIVAIVASAFLTAAYKLNFKGFATKIKRLRGVRGEPPE